MSEHREPLSSSPRLTPEVVMSESDGRFFQSLYEFIKHEKKYLRCPEEGPDETRYIIYRSAFNQVIGRATAYKRLLLAIKSEYDDCVRALTRREEEEELSVVQKETADVQQEVQRRRLSREQRAQRSEDPGALGGRLKELEAQRSALVQTLDVRAKLEAELKKVQDLRGRLSSKNQRLRVLFKRLRSVSEGLSHWEEEQEEEQEEQTHDVDLFEDDEPRGVDQSVLLTAYLDSWSSSSLGRPEEGDSWTVQEDMTEACLLPDVSPPGSAPPPLLFFQAVLMSSLSGVQLPASLSLQGVLCALHHGVLQLVVHAVSQNKLTLSEALGDVLTEHAQNHPSVSDLCLALATEVYRACRLHRKAALSMCRRGLVHSAAHLISLSKDATADDCMWVLCRSPSLPLLRLLTGRQSGRAAILPVGVACVSLLSEQQHPELALQLLDQYVSTGPGHLEQVMVEDGVSSVDTWTDVASLCSRLDRADLSRAVLSVLLQQSGTRILSPDPEGARLMEHVFL
ncbi:clathrin heavy chain linker domain-containing protein 1-like [Mugil cephalus]|uniref:clathrin heavy chain linker domain-containing protein 1-like n=1 Tax=Mugil cephalus TaxID=48193 RepID=UPI001FB666B4|nr:clathrin heavy chain linker domain-containing protein 1-like [Mugil cephalus]